MASFERQETVVLDLTVKDAKTLLLRSPATSVRVTITDPADTVVVSDQDFTQDAVGEFHYDYTPGGAALLGTYQVLVVATDGSRVTRTRDSFEVHA